METDVVIVGAGPAGLSAAKSAAKQGLKVMVLEKSSEIGSPIHTSGASWIKELMDLGIDKQFMHPIKNCRFLSPTAEAKFTYEEPVFCILDVRALYQNLAEEAAKSGARILVNTKVLEPIIKDGFVKGVKATSRRSTFDVNAKITIDASGFSSVIAKKVGLHSGFKRFGVGAEYDLYAPECDQDEILLIVGNRIAPSGYGWVFPYGNNRVRVGVGLIYPDSKENPNKYLDKLIHEIPGIFERFEGAAQIEYHRGVVPSEQLIKKCISNGLIVVGDSAGLINSLVGEGIRHAILTGKYAGEIAADAIFNKDYSESFLESKYSKTLNKFRISSEINHKINKHIAQYTDEKWDKKVKLMLNLTNEQFAELIKGEFSLNWMKNVLLKNPLFAGSALRLFGSFTEKS